MYELDKPNFFFVLKQKKVECFAMIKPRTGREESSKIFLQPQTLGFVGENERLDRGNCQTSLH